MAFDDIGNMTGKVSTSATTPRRAIGQELNYTLDYAYYDGKSHQAERIGDIWYLYDANGNVTEARQGGHSESSSTDGQVVAQGDVRWTSQGFGLDRGSQGGQAEKKVWARYYSWDEANRLKQSVEGELSVEYRYGSDGQRALKYSKRGESLYFDAAARFQRALQSIPLGKRREAPYAMWSESINGASIRQSKHVYVGQTRVSTRLNYKGHPDTGFEQANTYYYHGDHLGSAQLVTDPDGQEYEHLEYTPYGELWVEKTRDGIDAIPFRFTGKELDPETGLYYYGARYLDPKTSVWLSADPALGEYVPGAPTDEEARKRNGNLPGMGGVFNTVNLHLYHYAGNNPIKYTDPDGKAVNVLAGAFIGAVVSASMNVISQYASAKMSGSSFQLDVNQTLAAAAGGAVAGAITSGASAVASLCYQPTAQVATAVGGAIAGSAGSVVSTIVENGMGGKPLTDGVKESAVIGAIAGGVSSALVPAAKVLYRAPAPYTQITATSVARDTIKELGNGAKDEVITRSVKRALE